ncbi:MAG: hypothetical protein AAF985_19400 [Bacteroidota bacterium]
MKKPFVVILLFCFALSMPVLQAQTCCSAGAPITSSFAIGSSSAKSLAFQIDYEFNSVNLLIDNNTRLKNDPRTRNGHNFIVKTDYVLNENWAVSVFLPFVIQNRTTVSASESARGLGDLTLLGQYSKPVGQDGQLSFGLGIKLPTGSQFIRDERGINLSPDMQSGSGTYDFIGRLAYGKNHVFINNLSLQTAFSYRYNTTNQHFGDPEGIAGRRFKFGNESQWTTVFSYSIFSTLGFWAPELGLLLRHATPNQEQGINAPNSGGYWLRLPLGLAFRPNEQLSIRLSGELPIFQDLDGLQITTDYKLGLQLRYQLSFDKQLTPTIFE